jgi:hypothetical protein
VSPDGRQVVFVRLQGDRSDLALVGLDGRGLRALTRSDAGVQWSSPAFAPDGASVVASRWTAGGWLDLVRVDLATGAAEELTHDRAKDAEPAFSPDGAHVLFRSDRDGVSNRTRCVFRPRAAARDQCGRGSARRHRWTAAAPVLQLFGPRLRRARGAARPAGAATGRAVHGPVLPPRPAVEPAAGDDQAYHPLLRRCRASTPYFDTGGEGTSYGVATAGRSAPAARPGAGRPLNTAIDKLSGRDLPVRPLPAHVLRWTRTTSASRSRRARRTRDRELILQMSYPVGPAAQPQSPSLPRREREMSSRPQSGLLDLGAEGGWRSPAPVPVFDLAGEGLRSARRRWSKTPRWAASVALTTDGTRGLTCACSRDERAGAAAGGGTVGQAEFRQSYAVGGFRCVTAGGGADQPDRAARLLPQRVRRPQSRMPTLSTAALATCSAGGAPSCCSCATCTRRRSSTPASA